MGSSDGLDGEKPIHKVYLDAFYMAKYEVTNAQYKEFMDATGHKASLSWNESKFNTPNHPVLGVY
jgi:sulfatase modifying factor 1